MSNWDEEPRNLIARAISNSAWRRGQGMGVSELVVSCLLLVCQWSGRNLLQGHPSLPPAGGIDAKNSGGRCAPASHPASRGLSGSVRRRSRSAPVSRGAVRAEELVIYSTGSRAALPP